MKNVKILDCTLRDGGYLNDWRFGSNIASQIYNKLSQSNLDFIEVGYLIDYKYDQQKTLFNSIGDINNIIKSRNNNHTKIVSMLDIEKFNIDKIIEKTENVELDAIRIIFKKDNINEAFEYINIVRKNGYEIFINPKNILTYTPEELSTLIDRVNIFLPTAFSIVDTNGSLQQTSAKEIFKFIDSKLDNRIALCFHSHNNLDKSFSIAKDIIKICNQRNLIIDSTIMGMGRGAGNLKTEDLVEFLNTVKNTDYNLDLIKETAKKHIAPYYKNNNWGSPLHYKLSGQKNCHPYYAKYLIEKGINSSKEIKKIFSSIPLENKHYFDERVIENLCNDYSGFL